jgi:hypothetical protein
MYAYSSTKEVLNIKIKGTVSKEEKVRKSYTHPFKKTIHKDRPVAPQSMLK